MSDAALPHKIGKAPKAQQAPGASAGRPGKMSWSGSKK